MNTTKQRKHLKHLEDKIMKRSELTVEIMKDRGWEPTDRNQLRLKDIVYNIQNNEYWKYLRCTTDKDHVYTGKEFGMCSTYEIYKHEEFLEVSTDKKTWHKIASRLVEFNRRCLYAD